MAAIHAHLLLVLGVELHSANKMSHVLPILDHELLCPRLWGAHIMLEHGLTRKRKDAQALLLFLREQHTHVCEYNRSKRVIIRQYGHHAAVQTYA
jgi:hypothetical protein